MLRKQKSSDQGFTLVEVLIVVALIAILAVIALVTINPFEAQKRTRDARRLRDIGTMQGLVEQYIGDNPDDTAGYTASSNSVTTQDCSATSGWMGINMCPYANTLPVDPLNRSGEFAIQTSSGGVSTTGDLFYYLAIDGNQRYTICTRMESVANVGKYGEDNIDDSWFSIYNSTEATAPQCP